MIDLTYLRDLWFLPFPKLSQNRWASRNRVYRSRPWNLSRGWLYTSLTSMGEQHEFEWSDWFCVPESDWFEKPDSPTPESELKWTWDWFSFEFRDFFEFFFFFEILRLHIDVDDDELWPHSSPSDLETGTLWNNWIWIWYSIYGYQFWVKLNWNLHVQGYVIDVGKIEFMT